VLFSQVGAPISWSVDPVISICLCPSNFFPTVNCFWAPGRIACTKRNDAAYCYRCSVVCVYVCSVCLFVVSYCVLLCICKNIAKIALPSVRWSLLWFLCCIAQGSFYGTVKILIAARTWNVPICSLAVTWQLDGWRSGVMCAQRCGLLSKYFDLLFQLL